jgi:hypothetical protein
MSRENSPYVIGEYWLDQRRDGRSPGIWQIARYDAGSRSTVYRSTKQRALDDAIAWFRTWDAERQSKAKDQPREVAKLLPHLFNYLREQGPDVKRLDTVKSSFRAWIGFLQQDELGTGATIADIDKNFAQRFRRWRMKPHSWEVEWDDKTLKHESEGVSAKTVQRNIEDLRAALHHAEANNRFEAPKVASVDKKLIKRNPSQPFDLDTLGAIFGYAKQEKGLYRELALMLASGCRPGHAMKFDPASGQWQGDIMDLQPEREDQTNKHAAVLPVIAPLRPILADWKENPHDPVKSRKRTWRTMRRVLGLPAWAEAYCIRMTVATELDDKGTPGAQISGIIGHLPESRGVARTTSKHYLAYDPMDCPRAVEVLTALFEDVVQRSEKWAADHLRTTPLRGRPISLVARAENVYDFREKRMVGADGLEPPTLSV